MSVPKNPNLLCGESEKVCGHAPEGLLVPYGQEEEDGGQDRAHLGHQAHSLLQLAAAEATGL